MKKLLAAFLLLALVASPFLFKDHLRTHYCSQFSSYPSSWWDVKPGMRSDEIRKIIGEPWADGRDLKIVDRWMARQNGVELHMDLYFEGQNNADSQVISIYMWKRFIGYDTDKSIFRLEEAPTE